MLSNKGFDTWANEYDNQSVFPIIKTHTHLPVIKMFRKIFFKQL